MKSASRSGSRRWSREIEALMSPMPQGADILYRKNSRTSEERVLSISYAISTSVTAGILHSTCCIDVEPKRIVANATTTMSSQVGFNEQIFNRYKYSLSFPNMDHRNSRNSSPSSTHLLALLDLNSDLFTRLLVTIKIEVIIGI